MLEDSRRDAYASRELIVHRTILSSNFDLSAVVHAHNPYAVVEAEGKDTITPYDDEGRYFLPEIPVIQLENGLASKEVAQEIVNYTKHFHVAVIARHGVFAWGKSFDEAYHYATVVESACRINQLRGERK